MAEHRKTALITGASAGIGRELAKVFAQHRFDLVVVARSQDKLEQLAAVLKQTQHINVTVIVKDLMLPEAPQELFDAVQAQGIEIDVLVNNAGVGYFEPFNTTELDQILKLVQLNVVALTALTRLFLAPMVKRRRGRIMNVASVAGFQPTPTFAVYGASKAFALSLSEALAEELRGSGVTVTALCPGFTSTEMVHGAGVEGGIEQVIPSALLMDVETVAREGYAACMAGEVIHVNGLFYKLGVGWTRIQPRWLVRRAAGVWFGRVKRNH
jgi:short-subunit dehydrogenase